MAARVEFEPFFTKLGNSLSSNLGKSNLLKESNLFPESQSRSDLFQLGVTWTEYEIHRFLCRAEIRSCEVSSSWVISNDE